MNIGTTAAGNFKASIRARRPLLEHLFEESLKNLTFVQSQTEGSEEVTIAQWMSQDCANALVLILDYAIVRYLSSSGALKSSGRAELHRELERRGPHAYGGVKFARAIAALADLARHLHEFQSNDEPRSHVKEVLEKLALDKKHDQAAASFLQNLCIQGYDDFEQSIQAIAD